MCMKNMRFRKTVAVTLVSTLLISTLMSFYAQAATSISIDSVSLDITAAEIIDGDELHVEDIKITTPDSGYIIADKIFTNYPKSGWREGDTPRMLVTLNTKDGYRFSSLAATADGVNVNGGEPVYARLEDEHTTMSIYIDLPEVLENGWGYNEITVNNNVTGGPVKDSDKTPGKWYKMDPYGWFFQNQDGSITRNNWQKINGKWYFFNELGFALTNQWFLWKNVYYYLGPDGDMWTNRKTPDGFWVNEKGEWVLGAR